MATKKSTIVRDLQAAGLRQSFRALERVAPATGARIAQRVWYTVPRPPALAVRERRGVPDGAAFAVESGGSAVRGRVFGDDPAAPLAVLVHGWAGWWQQLGALVPPLLERGFRVVAFDAVAHGDSGPGGIARRGTSLPEMAASYRAVVEHHGAPALTVAHSMGAMSVLWAQREHGIVPDAQVLIAPAARGRSMLEGFASTLALGPVIAAGLEARFTSRVGRALDDFDVLPIVEAERRDGRLGPALIVHDRDDAVTHAADSERLADAWPDARLALTRELGHYRVLRAPEVVDAVGGFLDAVKGPRGAGSLPPAAR